MRLVLVGAVESTRVALETLALCGSPPVTVFTLPVERAGRHSDFVDLRPAAGRIGVPIMETGEINSPLTRDSLRSLAPDYLMIIGWSQLVRPEVRTLAALGAIGYHPSLLPRDRGRAVIPWTILLGRTETGSTLFWLDDGADSGDILSQTPIPVAPDETAASLYGKHMVALGEMLRNIHPSLVARRGPRQPQDHLKATWCARRTAEDGWIDWSRPARAIWTLIRAVGRPYPGAFTFQGDTRLVLWDAELLADGPYAGMPGQVQVFDGDTALIACTDGFIKVSRVGRPGEPDRPASSVLKLHQRLGEQPWRQVAPNTD